MKPHRTFRLILAAILLLVSLSVTGCATVKPWERSTLMRRIMKSSAPGSEAAFEGHVHTTREGMSGAAQSRGASCGCN